MEIKIPKTIAELTLKQYLEFTKTAEKITDDGSLDSILLTYKLVEIVSGATEEDIDELTIPEVNQLALDVKSIIEGFDGFKPEYKSFNIDGVDYASKDINNLDNGEYISLNILKEQYKNDSFAMFPKLLAILVRPAKLEYDFETKQEKWVIEKFNRRDVENLDWRADLFYNKAKSGDGIPIINFFLSTNKK